ncbi:MAG: outer membrane lipoprotein carrier protein LolA [Paludibacteraceae bacterium]
MKYYLFGLVLLLSATAVKAESAAAVLAKIRDNGTAINTIESRFVQHRHLQALKNDVVSNGRFYYQKNDKICMAYDRPQGDLLLMNGDDFVMIADGRRSVVNAQSNPMLKQMRILLTACVSGDFDRLKTGRNTQLAVDETDAHYILTATLDGSAQKLYASIVLTFDKQNLALLVLRMNEANGNFTEYTFDSPKFNQPIDGNVFDVNRQSTK